MSAKVCPRCGSLFQSLKSATCPQCFAILDTIDDQTAQELAAEKTKEESSEEFQTARKQDNEQWAEQSFQACLGIVAITLLTVVASIVILVLAGRHHRRAIPVQAGPMAITAPAIKLQGLSTAALPDEVLPAAVGTYMRTALQSDILLPGVTDSVLHATYILQSQGGIGSPIVGAGFEVFVIRETSLETNGDAFRLGCAMAAHVGDAKPRPILQAATKNWTYAVIGNNESDGAAKAQELLTALTTSANN